MSAALFEMAVHMGMELYSLDTEAREKYVNWYIDTNGGTNFPPTDYWRENVDAQERS